jgi:hypothetical protein
MDDLEDYDDGDQSPLSSTFLAEESTEEDKTKAEAVVKLVKKASSALILQRGALKRKITINVNKLLSMRENEALIEEHLSKQTVLINNYSVEIHKLDASILDTYYQKGLFKLGSAYLEKEIDNQAGYHMALQTQMGELQEAIKTDDTRRYSEPNMAQAAAVSLDIKPPVLRCNNFSGATDSAVEFKNFWDQFTIAIDNNKILTQSAKMIHLKSLLQGYASKVVAHLSISEANYKVCKRLLELEFSNEPAIIEFLLKRILSFKANKDIVSFDYLRNQLNELRSMLFELQTYRVDLLELSSAGSILISHIIIEKLPLSFTRELIHVTGSTYPNIIQILDNYGAIIRNLQKTTVAQVKDAPVRQYQQYDRRPRSTGYAPKTLQNFKTMSNSTPKQSNTNTVTYVKNEPNTNNVNDRCKPCKFCGELHPMYKCHEYKTLKERTARCVELKICAKCTGNHDTQICRGNKNKLTFPCYSCKSSRHISALCDANNNTAGFTNLCLSTNNIFQQFMLPTMVLEFVRNGHRIKVHAIVDTGSQRSYADKELISALGIDLRNHEPHQINIRTFLGTQSKRVHEVMVETYIWNDKTKYSLPILVDETMNLDFGVKGLKEAMLNIKKEGFELADSFLNNLGGDEVQNINCLLGNDFIQYIPQLKKVDCLNGFAWQTKDGIMPFGNVKLFLDNKQIKSMFHRRKEGTISNSTILSVPESVINNIMEPIPTYFDPYSHIKTDKDLDTGLEYLYKLESLGLDTQNEVSSIDRVKIDQLEKTIEFKNNKYYVELPWYENIINNVKSNYKVALAISDRVILKLESQNLLSRYNEILKEQLKEGVIERIYVKPEHYENFVWTPHRAVIKDCEITTSKLRIVYNCSMKINNDPSINDASYPGVNMLASLTKLLAKFRSNKYILLADIKSAFLMIKIKKQEDRNRLCFFHKIDGELQTFRFASLPFGLTSSMFILAYILRHHARKYPVDLCSKILHDNFYVDNLIFTHSDPKILNEVYYESNRRMQQGGFELRSWVTNIPCLSKIMRDEGKAIEHNKSYEKVLGYRYYQHNDTMSLDSYELDSNANTKRQILSQISKPFDPLSICSPVTIRGRLLMRSLWKQKTAWDQEVDGEHLEIWRTLCADYELLKEIRFPRKAVTKDMGAEVKYVLNTFADASKKSYGFSMYATSSEESNLVFSKTKVAPMTHKSIPSLELLAIYLAFKCVTGILNSYGDDYKFCEVNIFTDAQVVLGWLLATNLKVSQVFVSNRVKEIHEIVKTIKQEYDVNTSFYYVNTTQNPADLQTRGLSYKEFNKNFDFWMKGPEWLLLEPKFWPKYELLSMKDSIKRTHSSVKNQICTNVATMQHSAICKEPIIDINRFSDINKLFRVTNYVFKFINICRKTKDDINTKSDRYWLKCMQSEAFAPEIAYLQNANKSGKEIPAIVNQLNLFIDEEGMLRARGRISKSFYFKYDVVNPIMLGKKHGLTKLIIWDAHLAVKHLGLSATLNYIRNFGYWVTQGRQAVKNVIASCFLCEKMNAFAYKYPKFTNMSKPQMRLIRVYDKVGLDFTSHLWIKTQDGKYEKMYILLYTCMNIRAIHIDILPDMSTKSVLYSLQRFSNLYGVPSQIYTDGFTSFVKGSEYLRRALVSDDFSEFMRKGNIKAIQIPTYSGWVGTLWERLIKTVKQALNKAIGKSRLNYYEMLTLLSSIQNAVNGRPLTYQSNEVDVIPLTPNSFLKLHCNKNLIFKESLEQPDTYLPNQDELTRSLATQMQIFDNFKTLWYTSYLTSLRENSRNIYQDEWVNRININDIVLIKNPIKPRIFWSLGRITALYTGDDGKIRSVQLKTGNGHIAHHSICNLYPLELSLTHNGNSVQRLQVGEQPLSKNPDEKIDISDHDKEMRDINAKPKRKAALEAQKRWRDNINLM